MAGAINFKLVNEGETIGGQCDFAGFTQASDFREQNPVRPMFRHSRSIKDCVRMVVFNTKSFTVKQMWQVFGGVLDKDSLSCILKIKAVNHLSGNPRMDLWVQQDFGESLTKTIRELFREKTPALQDVLRHHLGSAGWSTVIPRGWRMDYYRPWRDRQDLGKLKGASTARKPPSTIVTLNINGLNKRQLQLADLLSREAVAVCALQETLVNSQQYPIRMTGYNTFAIPWQEGFRGQAVLVDNRLASYWVPHGDEKHFLHVKISNWQEIKETLHIFSVYFPSGGNHRKTRRLCLERVVKCLTDILKNDADALFMVLGDYNMTQEALDRLDIPTVYNMPQWTSWKFRGSELSRFPRKGKPSALDKFSCAQRCLASFRNPRVLRSYSFSDHRPVMVEKRFIPILRQPTEKRTCFDPDMIRRNKRKLVNSNRWALLQPDRFPRMENGGQSHCFNDVFRVFTSAMDLACRDAGAKRDVVVNNEGPQFPRKLKRSSPGLDLGGMVFNRGGRFSFATQCFPPSHPTEWQHYQIVLGHPKASDAACIMVTEVRHLLVQRVWKQYRG